MVLRGVDLKRCLLTPLFLSPHIHDTVYACHVCTEQHEHEQGMCMLRMSMLMCGQQHTREHEHKNSTARTMMHHTNASTRTQADARAKHNPKHTTQKHKNDIKPSPAYGGSLCRA